VALRSRRVVTGHDAHGKAVVLRDDVPEVQVRARTGGRSQQMWYTAETPAEAVTAADPTGKIAGTNAAGQR